MYYLLILRIRDVTNLINVHETHLLLLNETDVLRIRPLCSNILAYRGKNRP